VTVANNNIMNGKTGYVVKNSVASQVSLILNHNYILGNPANFYPSSLVNTNPATSPNPRLATATAPVQPAVPLANASQKQGTASKKPVANFWGSPKSGKAPLSVTFTDISTGSPTGYKWDFGDGTTSTAKNPGHKYGKTGIYTATLTVTNDAGSGKMIKYNYIKVTTK
jgi:PKD repeat protein